MIAKYGEQRELLQAHEARTLAGRDAHAVAERRAVLVRVRVPAVLHEPDAPGGGSRSRRGSRDRAGESVGIARLARDGPTTLRERPLLAGARGGADTCWVMQCTPPPPYASTAPGTADDLAVAG